MILGVLQDIEFFFMPLPLTGYCEIDKNNSKSRGECFSLMDN